MLAYDVDAKRLPVKRTHLPEGLRFRDIETALEGLVSRERALTRFLPQGYATPTWVHITDEDDEEYTVVVHPLLGRAEVFDERIEAH